MYSITEGFSPILYCGPDVVTCMEINVSVQYNGGLLPDIILWTRCSYIGEPF